MREAIWRAVAFVVTRPRVASWLIARSHRTPYTPIHGRRNGAPYMLRHWLFNAYPESGGSSPLEWLGLPSIRVHTILQADDDGHLHDHPWNARRIILSGSYLEELPAHAGDDLSQCVGLRFNGADRRKVFRREAGHTSRVLFGDFHRISDVSKGGCVSLWFSWKYRGTWGFSVDGEKVPYRKHLGLDE